MTRWLTGLALLLLLPLLGCTDTEVEAQPDAEGTAGAETTGPAVPEPVRQATPPDAEGGPYPQPNEPTGQDREPL